MNNKNICLVSLTASHYRKLIYLLLDKHLGCDFIFGKQNTTVKRLDLSIFRNARYVPNLPLGSGRWYRMPGALKLLDPYDVIINDMGILCTTSWLYMINAKIRGNKTYLWDHGWYGREGLIKKWMKRIYFGLADGAFIYGNYAKKLMIKNGFDGTKLHVIHNSLDYDSQIEIRVSITKSDLYQNHFKNDNPVLCFIGRLTPVKKLDQLLEAVNILNGRGEQYNIIYVGDGDMLTSLKQITNHYNLSDYVWFYGACYDEKTNAELIYNADMCVAPGNIGLTAMHAMMYGCPCVSHNDFSWQMPEFEAIQEGVTGAFFERNNVNSLADTISRWFNEKRFRREEVRKACYKEIDENWNPHKQLDVIKRVIESK